MSPHKLIVTGLATLSVLAGGLAFSSAPALAVPEEPLPKPATEITATTAVLHGELNPHAPGKPGEKYVFAYRVSTQAELCTPEETFPEPFGKSLGEKEEAVEIKAEELQPSQTYAFCLIVDPSGAFVQGPSLTFKTLAAKPTVVSEAFSGVTPLAATLEARINPNNQETTYKFEYATSEAQLGTPEATTLSGASSLSGFSEAGELASVEASGLTPSTVYYYRVVAENTSLEKTEGPVQQFETLAPLPSATTGRAVGVTRTAATLTGVVNPEGNLPGSNTTWCFEYGRTSKYESGIVGTPENAGQGTEDIDVTATLGGLEPNRTYHYRLVAVNNLNTAGPSEACNTSGGYETDGQDESFTTIALPPLVSTDEVAAVTATTATLDGSIVPQEVDTRYHFEYGTTTSYGASAPVPDGDAGTATTGQPVTESIHGLTPNTTYHYRLVGTSSGGTTYGWDQTFTTPSPVPPASTGSALATGAGPSALPVAFPNLSGLSPMPPPSAKPTVTPKALTNAQRLSKALKACKKDKSKSKRAKCEKEARRKYGPRARKKK